MIWSLAAYAVYCVAIVTQLSLHYRFCWRYRKLFVGIAGLSFIVSCPMLLIESFNISNTSLTVLAVYSLVNLLRIVYAQTGEAYLYRASNISVIWLGGLQVSILCITAIVRGQLWNISAGTLLAVVVAVQALCAGILLLSTVRRLNDTNPTNYEGPKKLKRVSDDALPSITIAVPARNEDAQLQECLDSLLLSDYPKLEILVLDDCSDDRTSDIIKAYAHDGVRFVRGSEPDGDWLPKNQAYDRLLREASGALVLFCGVDIRVAPTTIRRLELLMRTHDATMITVLPQNHQAKTTPIVQSMRYFWEMSPPRKLFRRPPVLSSFWMAQRSMIAKSGSFAAVKHSISPEGHIARYAARTGQYTFVRSLPSAKSAGEGLGVESVKDSQDQREMALYIRYPQLHRRPEFVLLLAVVEIVLLLGPLLTVVVALLFTSSWLIVGIAFVAYMLNCFTFAAVQSTVFTKPSYINNLIAFGMAIAADIWLTHASMLQYEFGSVRYKDRDVRRPIMRQYEVIPHLPPLKKRR